MKLKRMVLIAVAMVGALTACGSSSSEEDLLSIEVRSGLKHDYELDEVVNLANVEVDAIFETKTKVIKARDLTFTPATLDTSVEGDFTINIKYLTADLDWDYTVSESFDIDNLSAPAFVTDYYSNISEKANKRTEFIDREQGYYVGADNPFKYLPIVNAYNSKDQEVILDEFDAVVTLEKKEEETYTLLDKTAFDNTVTFDIEQSTYQFKESAIDHTYRLTVRPAGERYATHIKYRSSFEFKVVAGFNVYTQDDLAHFNNIDPVWDSYLESRDISKQAIHGLIFHNNIDIERQYLPNAYFYMEGDADLLSSDSDYLRTKGSLRDAVNLYHRSIASDETFVLNGNYFNLSYEDLPVVTRENGAITDVGRVISHATLIHAGITEIIETEQQGQFVMKNLSVTGNANRSEALELSGGTLFDKISATKAHIYNTIATQAFTIHSPQELAAEVVIEKSRGYDSYSSLLYSWGCGNFTIKDSEFIGAGGPVLITDHGDHDEFGKGGYPPHTHIINSHLESFVSGGEGWFKLVSAVQAAAFLVDLGEELADYGTNGIIRTVNINGIDVSQFNLIAVIKSGNAQGPTSDKIRGTLDIDQGVGLDFEGDFLTGTLLAEISVSAPRFQSSDGQVAIYNGEYFFDGLGNLISPYADSQTNYFSGDYMNLYLSLGGDGFMGLVFGLA